MPSTTQTRQKARRSAPSSDVSVPAGTQCDNHPNNLATFTTTSRGRHSRVYLCDSCIPRYWR